MAESAESVQPQTPHENRFKAFLKSFGAKFSRNRETLPQSKPVEVKQPEPKPEPDTEQQQELAVVEEPVDTPEQVTRPKNIASYIYQEIEKRGLKPTEYEERGVSDFDGTNERVEIDLLHKLRGQAQPPNGYVIGIGVSNIFSLFEAFDEKNPPKGIVLGLLLIRNETSLSMGY